MPRLLPLLLVTASLAGALLAPASARAQRADRMAVEAVVEALLPEDGRRIYVGPELLARGVQGRVSLDEANRTRLRMRFAAAVRDLEDVAECTEPDRPETCSLPGHSVFYQFVMPDPIQDGRLSMRVIRLLNGTGQGVAILRESWRVVLVQEPGLGWTVVGKELEATADGPW